MKKLNLLLCFTFLLSFSVAAQFSAVTPLNEHTIDVGAGTQDKSQSKLFMHDGLHWAAFADAEGTHLWRLDGNSWTHVIRLTTKRGRADCKVVGNTVHILVFQNKTSQLVSVEYDAATKTYKPWTQRSSAVTFSFNEEVQTATIDTDENGRMWIAYVRGTDVQVQWSDTPYGTWSSPITIASGVRSDDEAAVIAMPGKVGVLWSNQNTMRWGFKTHATGAAPSSWSADEVPASQSAENFKGGMADDHMNMKVSSDGTLYCAIKTSYNDENHPLIALLVRRPTGSWDDLHSVSSTGTTPIVVINEKANKLRVIYPSKTYGGDILYNESPMSAISFGPKLVLMQDSAYRDPTSSKQNMNTTGVVLATDATAGIVDGVMVSDNNVSPPPPALPATPTLASPQNAATSVALAPTLTWNAAQGATTYQLQVATSADFANNVVNESNLTATSRQVSGLSNLTTYYWRVRASNTAGNSAWSDTWAFTTLEQQSPPPPTGVTLVGHWKMDEGGGTTLFDASGYANDAVLQNTSMVEWVPGVYGLALELPGRWYRFAVAPHSPSLDITAAITIAAWIKPAVVKGRMVLSKVDPDGYQLGVSGNGKVEFMFNSTTAGTTYRLYSKTSYPADGQTWMHIAATYDGKTARIYINGVEDNAATYPAAPAIGSNTSSLVIGALRDANRWTGAMDDVRLYKGALSAAEVATLSNGGTATEPEKEEEVKDGPWKANSRVVVYPNPFNSKADINFSVRKDTPYTLTLFDGRGKQISVLSEGTAKAGEVYTAEIDGTNMSKGLYFLRLITAKGTSVTKIMFDE